jgi:hypothetical protein
LIDLNILAKLKLANQEARYGSHDA